MPYIKIEKRMIKMLKKQMTQYVEKLLTEKQGETCLELFKEEKQYIEKHGLLADPNVTIEAREPLSRFDDIYLERCDKETEELIAIENATFLEQPIDYFKNHINEFIYVESNWFDIINVDAISFEVDSVFGSYDVMLGLKVQKKLGNRVKSFLLSQLKNDDAVFELMFNQSDGLFDMNFSLNDLDTFNEKWTIKEAFFHIYSFLFRLSEYIENES
jgi:hypothetical protein